MAEYKHIAPGQHARKMKLKGMLNEVKVLGFALLVIAGLGLVNHLLNYVQAGG